MKLTQRLTPFLLSIIFCLISVGCRHHHHRNGNSITTITTTVQSPSDNGHSPNCECGECKKNRGKGHDKKRD